jgi:hypothetical protein
MSIKSVFKSIGSAFKRAGVYVVGKFKSVIDHSDQKVFEQLLEIAVPVAEVVSRKDLDGNGRVSSAVEIVSAVEKTGLLLGKELAKLGRADLIRKISEHYSENDIKRYLAASKVIIRFIGLYGPSLLPKQTRLINQVVEIALDFIP